MVADMALERRRPLPAGRYWLDVFPKNAIAWQSWSEAMTKLGSATIEHTEHFEAIPADTNLFDTGSVPAAPAHDFVIFSTSTPNIAWEAAGLPSPTIAPASVQSSDDTVTKPPPEPSVLDQLSSAAAGVGTTAKVGLGVGVAVVVVVGAVALFRRT